MSPKIDSILNTICEYFGLDAPDVLITSKENVHRFLLPFNGTRTIMPIDATTIDGILGPLTKVIAYAGAGLQQTIDIIVWKSPAERKAYESKMRDIEAGDHRIIGTAQKLFYFDDLSPGSCFFLPHGTRIYNTLVAYIRKLYRVYGFDEVITPNIYNVKLWEQSGHLEAYKENMFLFDVGQETFAMKPMNCPGHCLLYAMEPRTLAHLPIRFADFGVLHRNEASGALSGLTRVRRFQQDDAHIFAAPEQIQQEVSKAISFMREVYQRFDLRPSMALSTRPDAFIGDIHTWDMAEKHLTDGLNASGMPWTINAGDGAFYGPKIDITVKDIRGRSFQCATIQLDFQLPQRFNLFFTRPDGTVDRPVMIHRAVLGSVERMIAILTEHYHGEWPMWLSPRQICLIPVTPEQNSAVESLADKLNRLNFYVDVDTSNDTFRNKIRKNTLMKYNYIGILGHKEIEDDTISIRIRNERTPVTTPLSEFLYSISADNNL